MSGGKLPVFPAPFDSTGIVLLGGELTPAWVLAAYAQGVFPWPIIEDHVEHLAWFSPDPRAVLPLAGLHVSRRLARRIRSGQFEFSMNRRFVEVVESCAAPRGHDDGVWLSKAMQVAYWNLHQIGHSHTFEVWAEGELVAGILGISLGGLFSAESMFHRARDAGNAALKHMVTRLNQCGFALLDIQQASPHMQQRGAIDIPRDEYLDQLQMALRVQPEQLAAH